MECKFIKDSGTNCKRNAMKNGFCYFHNPEISEADKKQAVSKGGKANKLIRVNNDFPLYRCRNAKDVSKLLITLINEVLQNNLDLRIATGITYIANVLLKSYEQTELSERLDNIEELIEKSELLKNN